MTASVRGYCTAALLLALAGSPSTAVAHGGGLNAEGCHHNRKTGDYHCHRAPAGGSARKAPSNAAGFVDTTQSGGGSGGARNAAGKTERRLEELKRLRDRGLVTEEEYVTKKRRILDDL